MSDEQPQGLSFLLRSGESCALHGETLVVGQRQIALRDIVSAGLVADTSVPVPPGMPPTPGVSLRLGDGSVLAFTPGEQLDCWRLLQALAAARPELAAPLPPPPTGYGAPPGHTGSGSLGAPTYSGYGGYGYSYGAPPYGYVPAYGYGYGAAGPSETERTLAGICHLSVFFAPVILPLIIWLTMAKTQPYASQQAKQAFWFHLILVGISVLAFVGMEAVLWTFVFSATAITDPSAPVYPTTIGSGVFLALLIGYGVMAVAGAINLVFSIIAAIHGFQGRPYHYPLLGRLVR